MRLRGAQMYEDETCTTPGSGYKKPESHQYVITIYSIGAMETLADGTSGYPLHIEETIVWPDMPEPTDPTNNDDDMSQDQEEDDNPTGDVTIVDAYIGLPDSQTLCFSSNVFFDTEVSMLNPEGDASVVDYERCLVLYGSVEDLPDASVPFPETDPEEETVELTNTGWLADNICYPEENGLGSYQRVFEFLFTGIVLNSSFLDYTTPDCTGESRPDHIAWTEDQGQFSDLGEETLSDGVVGHRIQITNPATNLNETIGYYVINDMEELCVSYNLGLNSDANASSTDIDYAHCLKSYDWTEWGED
jgi:hypothetical protein